MVETQETQDFSKKDTLAAMIVKKFWVNWIKFKQNNMARLANIAWVSEEEYKNAKWDKSAKYNNKIREEILKNHIPPLHEYSEVLKRFSPEQQKALGSTFRDKQVNTYMSSLTTSQIEKFKQLSPNKLVSLLANEIKNVQIKKERIKNNNDDNWTTVQEKTTEQILVLDQLNDVEKRIDKLLETQEFLKIFKINTQWKFEDTKTNTEYLSFSQKFKQENIASYEERKNIGGEKKAEENLRYAYVLEKVHTQEFQSKMDENTKKEFNSLVVEYCELNQKLGINIAVGELKQVYEDAKQYFVERYTKNDVYTKLLNNINSDPEVTTYFTAHKKTTELVSEPMKDKSYYTKLLTWYPDLDTQENNKKISEYLSYLNDDMTIKTDTPDDQKKIITWLLPRLKEQGKTYEEKLLKRTNASTQNVAIQQCITTLQKYMDVNISEKDNIVQQLKVSENKNGDAVSSDMVFHVEGTLNGKKIALSYNLETGAVTYKSFLTKKADNDQSPLTLGSWSQEDQVPLITLPKFGDFVEVTDKKTDYHTLINESTTLDEYDKNFTEHLQSSVQRNMDNDMDIQKDMLKKFIIKDMITQNIFSLTGKPNEMDKNGYMITPNAQPQSYMFYNMIYKSLEYYSMGSIDQLQLFQNNINTLVQYRNGSFKTQSTEDLMKRKDKNNEMFVLQAITNQSIIRPTNTMIDQWPEKQLWSFFSCFERQTLGISIIDSEMMNDYFKAATGTNKEDNKLGKWQRNQKFTSMVNDIDHTIWWDLATENLDTQLENIA